MVLEFHRVDDVWGSREFGFEVHGIVDPGGVTIGVDEKSARKVHEVEQFLQDGGVEQDVGDSQTSVDAARRVGVTEETTRVDPPPPPPAPPQAQRPTLPRRPTTTPTTPNTPPQRPNLGGAPGAMRGAHPIFGNFQELFYTTM